MMSGIFKRKLVIAAVMLAAAAFAGGAYAASTTGTSQRQQFLGDVAKRLNVTPAQLQSALQGAFDDRLQAAVNAGKLTQAQANAIEQRVQKTGVVPFGFGGGLAGPRPLLSGPRPPLPGGPPPAPFGRFLAAATYLGITAAQLRDQLAAGKSLAQIATAHGKSVSGLEAAMTAAIKAKLDKAVAAKLLTNAQEQRILKTLSGRVDAQVTAQGLGKGQWKLRRFFGPPPGGPGKLNPALQLPQPAPPQGPMS
jgi:hypothetical protein